MVRFSLDAKAAPQRSRSERRRLDRMSEVEITAAALDDADNPPFTSGELRKLRSARLVRRARQHSGLSQTAFAKAYRINVARLRDLEQGRTRADSALCAYFRVIERDPDAVRRALGD